MQRAGHATSEGIVGPQSRAPRLVVAALGLVLTLLLAEVIARIEGPPICLGTEGFLLAADPEVGWTFTPGLTFTMDPCAPPLARRRWSAPVSINQHGLHDQEWTYEKRPGEVRVLLLGGEAADGIGVARADRLSVRLAHLTDRRRGARVAAINALIPGYGPHEALRFLERRGLRYAPDVVVLLLDPQHDLAASVERPEAVAPGETFPPASGLLDLSGVARWLARRPGTLPHEPVAVAAPEPLAEPQERARAEQRLADVVRQIAQTSAAGGARLAIVIAPRCPIELPAASPSLCATLESIAPCTDLSTAFAELEQAAPGANELCLPYQPRWGRDAHFLASHRIWDLLAASGLWPEGVVRGHRL